MVGATQLRQLCRRYFGVCSCTRGQPSRHRCTPRFLGFRLARGSDATRHGIIEGKGTVFAARSVDSTSNGSTRGYALEQPLCWTVQHAHAAMLLLAQNVSFPFAAAEHTPCFDIMCLPPPFRRPDKRAVAATTGVQRTEHLVRRGATAERQGPQGGPRGFPAFALGEMLLLAAAAAATKYSSLDRLRFSTMVHPIQVVHRCAVGTPGRWDGSSSWPFNSREYQRLSGRVGASGPLQRRRLPLRAVITHASVRDGHAPRLCQHLLLVESRPSLNLGCRLIMSARLGRSATLPLRARGSIVRFVDRRSAWAWWAPAPSGPAFLACLWTRRRFCAHSFTWTCRSGPSRTPTRFVGISAEHVVPGVRACLRKWCRACPPYVHTFPPPPSLREIPRTRRCS